MVDAGNFHPSGTIHIGVVLLGIYQDNLIILLQNVTNIQKKDKTNVQQLNDIICVESFNLALIAHRGFNAAVPEQLLQAIGRGYGIRVREIVSLNIYMLMSDGLQKTI